MRTTFCWICAASSAWPTSRTSTGAWPSPTFTGTSSISLRILDHAVGVDEVVGVADLRVAGGNDEVGVVQRVDDVHQRQAARLERLAVGVHHDLAVLAAEGRRHRRARHRRQLVADVVLRLVAELRFREALARHRDQRHRQRRGVGLEHQRRQRSRRQVAQVGHRQVGERGRRRVDVGARVEEDLDDAHAGQRARLDVLDVAAQREEALEAGRDVALDLDAAACRDRRSRPRPPGSSDSGKTSTGMRANAVTPSSATISAPTMMVCGLRSENPGMVDS